MATDDRTKPAESRIRARIESWAKAVRAKDVDAVISHFAPDVVSYDLAPPLAYVGATSIRKSLASWFRSFRGNVGYEVTDLHIDTSGDLALCRSLNHITGARTDGETTDVWVRATVGLRRIGGEWLVTHEHSSVPFYMDGSYKAAIDLKP